MSWIKLDDGFPDHPKVRGLSHEAFRLYVSALCYSGKYLLDGVLTKSIMESFGVGVYELLESNLVDSEGENYRIHDYLKHQSSKETIERGKEANRKRVSKHLQTNGISNGISNAKLMEPDIDIDIDIEHKDNGFDAFWILCPRKEGKGAARISYAKALKKVSKEELLNSMAKFASDPNLPDLPNKQYIPFPSVWLNQERWGDDPLPSRMTISKFEITTPTPIPPRVVYEPEIILTPEQEARITQTQRGLREKLIQIRQEEKYEKGEENGRNRAYGGCGVQGRELQEIESRSIQA